LAYPAMDDAGAADVALVAAATSARGAGDDASAASGAAAAMADADDVRPSAAPMPPKPPSTPRRDARTFFPTGMWRIIASVPSFASTRIPSTVSTDAASISACVSTCSSGADVDRTRTMDRG